MVLDPTQPVPLYFQLKALILEQISSGIYLPGDRIPTEHELCEIHGVSRTPVHRALAELANDGVIVRRRRHGTVVNPHWLPERKPEQDLRVLVANQEWLAYIQEAAPPDVSLNVLAVGYPNLHRHITRAVAEGQAPDLLLVDSVWVEEFAEAGLLAPLDEIAPAWIASDYDDFLPRFEHRSRPYAVSAEANVAGLWYRRETFASHNLGIPRTWEELLATGHRLATLEPKMVPLAMPLGSGAGETTTYCLAGLLATNGAGITTGQVVTLDCTAAAETLSFILELVDSGIMKLQAVTHDWDRAAELLASGHAAMSIGGTYEAPAIAETAGLDLHAVDDHFGFAPLPHGPQGHPASVVGGMAYAIPKQSRRPKEAMRVLRALVEPASVAKLAYATGTMPGRRSVVEKVSADLGLVRATAELLEVAVRRPQTVAYNRVSTQLQLMVESVVLRRMTPQEAVTRTAGHIGAITGMPVIGDPVEVTAP